MIVEGDIAVAKAAGGDIKGGRTAVFGLGAEGYAGPNIRSRWERSDAIPYEIAADVPNPQRILDAFEEYHTRTKLRFVPRTSEADFIHFELGKVGSGCFSAVGRIGGAQPINLEDWCEKGPIIHELGHALGLLHEQSREDRDDYIVIRWDHIFSQLNQYSRALTAAFDFGPYDYQSIMHYPSILYPDGVYDMIGVDGTVIIGQNTGKLSDLDVQALHGIYSDNPLPPSFEANELQAVPPLPIEVLSDTSVRANVIDNASDETEVRLEYGTSKSEPLQFVSRPGDPDVSWWKPEITGLTPNTRYYFRAVALKGALRSPETPWKEAITKVRQPPAAPTNLRVVDQRPDLITVAWDDNSQNEDRFVVRHLGGKTPDTKIDLASPVAANVTSFTIVRPLYKDTAYLVGVFAQNSGGYSQPASLIVTTTNQQIAAPSNFKVETLSESELVLTWKDNSDNEQGFSIERTLGKNGQLITGGTPLNVTTLTNNKLASGTEYCYRIRAYLGTAFSEYATNDPVCGTTKASIPEAPDNLKAAANGANAIGLSWRDNSKRESGYRVFEVGAGGTATLVTTLGANYTNYVHQGLAANSAHTYVVRAFNDTGPSAVSNQASATTAKGTSQPSPTPTTPGAPTPTRTPVAPAATPTPTRTPVPVVVIPNAPSGLAVESKSTTSVSLVWNDNSNNETGFQIGASGPGGTTISQVGMVGAGTTRYTVSGLQTGMRYYFAVTSSNSAGQSAPSNRAESTTALLAPTGVTATAQADGRVAVSWQPVSGANDQLVELMPPGGSFQLAATLGANASSFTTVALQPGQQYYIRVLARTPFTASPSDNIPVTIPMQPPAAPSNGTAAPISQTRVDLGWSDNSSNETSFDITYSSDNGATYQPLARVGANVRSFTVNGLVKNHRYYFRIYAVNGNLFSQPATCQTTTRP